MAKKLKFDIHAQDKTKRAFSAVTRRLSAIKKSVFSLKGALVGAFGVAGVVSIARFGKAAIEAADKIAKTADAVGITTDALQEYRHAAELSGVETAKMDKAIMDFGKRMGEMRADTGALTTFLKKHDTALLSTLKNTDNVTDGLKILFNALAKVKSQVDKDALAFAAFGRSGTAMTVMVKNGTEGLQRMREEARRLGLIISEDMLRGAEAANDQLTRMQKIIGVQLTNAILKLSPQIVALSQKFIDGLPGLIAWTTKALEFLNIIEPTASMDELVAELGEIEAKQEKLNELWEMNPGKGLARSIRETTAEYEKAASAIREQINALNDLNKAKKPPAEEAAGTGPLAADEEFLKSTAKITARLKKQIVKETEAGQRALERIRETAKSVNADRIQMINLRLQKELAAVDELRLTEAEAAEARRLLNETAVSQLIEENKRIFEEAKQQSAAAAEEVRTNFNAAFDGMTDSLSSAVQGVVLYGKTWSEVGRDIGRQVIASIIDGLVTLGARIAANFVITQAFGKAAAAAAIGEGATVASAWAPAAAMTSLATFGANAVPASAAIASTAALSQGLAFAGGLERGGPVSFDKSFLVGEAGPELFIPGRSGTVVSNDNLRGGGTVINIDARGAEVGVEERIRTVLNRERPGILRDASNLSIAAVQARADQGGGFAKAMGRR